MGSAPSRNIIRFWLARARMRLRLLRSVQSIINKARKVECEMCLSRRQLSVELVIPIEVMGEKFAKQTNSEEFDVNAWKEFFGEHEKFKTMCLNCRAQTMSDRQQAGGLKMLTGSPADGFGEQYHEMAGQYGTINLNAASIGIMRKWYNKAQHRIASRPGGKKGQKRRMLVGGALIELSDDEDDDLMKAPWAKRPLHLNQAQIAIMRKWHLKARENVRFRVKVDRIKEKDKWNRKNDPSNKPKKKKPPEKKAPSGKKSKMKRK